jgi:vancomycin resistance protein YoaR
VNTLAPFSYNNGYVNGIIIKDGKDVTAMGGGVCQSVTTMFRSWQNSGLEVTKFQPHSKSISYYGGIGFDATMYKAAWRGGDVDLLLKNNSENSILIKVVDSDPYQMIFLYGTRDRKVSLKRYHFSKYNGNQVAKWKRSIEYKNSGEWVDNFFQEWQKLY